MYVIAVELLSFYNAYFFLLHSFQSLFKCYQESYRKKKAFKQAEKLYIDS